MTLPLRMTLQQYWLLLTDAYHPEKQTKISARAIASENSVPITKSLKHIDCPKNVNVETLSKTGEHEERAIHQVLKFNLNINPPFTFCHAVSADAWAMRPSVFFRVVWLLAPG